jgi:ribosomal protein L11 methyltransferase
MYLWRKSATPRWLEANETVLQAQAGDRLAIIEKPERKRSHVEVSCQSAEQARQLISEFGGKVEKLPSDWLRRFARTQKSKPLKIGKRLILRRSNVGGISVSRRSRHQGPSYLVIPAGAAFGTGDHATTAMSLRLLEKISRTLKPGWSLIDLGTGSGILALAAKRFGAGRVIAIDNDQRAIATAKENARGNKIDKVDFRVADVRRWKSPARIDLVTANLFSELLVEILPKLARVRRLILSGIMRTQEAELRRALRRQKIDVLETRRRGKWVALVAQKQS